MTWAGIEFEGLQGLQAGLLTWTRVVAMQLPCIESQDFQAGFELVTWAGLEFEGLRPDFDMDSSCWHVVAWKS